MKIVLSYVMSLNDGVCPFLSDDNKCLIHNMYKPLTCRSFPYVPRIIRYVIDRERRYLDVELEISTSRVCPILRALDQEVLEEVERDPAVAARVFPAEYKACVESIRIRRMYLSALSMLWRADYVMIDEDRQIISWPHVNAFLYLRQFIPDLTIAHFL